MRNKTYPFIAFLTLLLCLTLINFKKGFAKESDTTKGNGNYYDAGILDNGSNSGAKKVTKNKKHRHGRKGKAKRNKNGMSSNPGGPQEDVTDQKEVSEQADQSNSKSKK